MTDHLRYAGASADEQRGALQAIIRAEPVLMALLRGIRELALPDGLLAAGVIYNAVWNSLTGRPALSGVRDADIAYFDGSDLSYEAEDAVIQRAVRHFAALPLPVEVRNQARVHLWFPQKFGTPYPQLQSSAEMMLYYASRPHAVAARLESDDHISLLTPFGLDDLFAFRMTPNPALNNRATHALKAARAKANWPEVTVIPWPD